MTTDGALGRRDTETLAHKQAQFEQLLHAHRGILFKVAHTFTRNEDDRRDLIQDIAAQVWRAFPTFDERRKFSTWMYRIALNVAISFRRSAASRQRHVDTIDPAAFADMPGSGSTESDDRLRELGRLVDRLDDFHRALVVLYLEGYDHREIGEILGMTDINVATRLSRLKTRLRNEGPHGTR